MSVQPEGEDLRKAVKWVLEEADFDPKRTLKDLIREACLKFDLSPLEADFLAKTLRERIPDSDSKA